MRRSQATKCEATKLAETTWQHCVRVVIMLGVVCTVSGLVGETIDLREQHRAMVTINAGKQADLDRERRRHADLIQQRRFLESDRGIVASARTLNLGKDGERRVMFDDELPDYALPGAD